MNAPATMPQPSLAINSGGRRHSNLALALILLPKERRKDSFHFYDFCRMVDDIADEGNALNQERRESLNSWIEAFESGNETHLSRDFSEMIMRRKLDRQLLIEIVRGMKMDIPNEGEGVRYASFDDLHLYCWRAASCVGLASASIFGAQGVSVELYAKELGIALQLTNILRDVAADAAMNRIYLPQEDLIRFSVSEDQILSCVSSPEMTHLLNYQAERADSYFAKAEMAWIEMSANQRRLMRPARLMSAIYRELLLAMHRDRYDVLHKKYQVSHFRKLILTLQTLTARS